MASWVKLTELYNGARLEIHVNLDQVSSIQPSGKDMTTVWFLAGHPKGKIDVLETPEQIFAGARAFPHA